jgi:hypothetical protein
MLAKLLLSGGQKLTERMLAAITLPAVGFWFVGLVVLYFSPAYTRVSPRLKIADTVSLALWGACAFGAVAISGSLVSYLAPEISKLTMGDWPAWLDAPAAWLRKRKMLQYERQRDRLQALAAAISTQGWESLTADQVRTYGELERWLLLWPSDKRHVMPTKLGNLLRAAESRPADKYGLEPAVVWPRLELVAPQEARSLMEGIQNEFQAIGRLATWSALLPVWVCCGPIWGMAPPRLYFLLGLLPIGGILFLIAYQRSVFLLERFCEAFEAIFDLYRAELYRALRLPLPGSAGEEHRMGCELTAYLLRGSRSPSLYFEPGPASAAISQPPVKRRAEEDRFLSARAGAESSESDDAGIAMEDEGSETLPK